MTQNANSRRIHPLVAGAAVSVILVSMVGVAAITGLLPNSNSTPAASLPSVATLAAEQSTQTNTTEVPPARMSNGHGADAPANHTASHADAKPAAHHAATHALKPAYEHGDGYVANAAQVPAICESCGVVESVRAVEHQAEHGSGLGAVAGALLGGVLGNQVGGGDGRKLATVAGAVGGGYAGNSIEKRSNTTTTYEVRVRMENGNTRTFTPSSQPDWRAGDRVRVNDGHLTARG